jgi:hypothetical protein
LNLMHTGDHAQPLHSAVVHLPPSALVHPLLKNPTASTTVLSHTALPYCCIVC